jgi:hypothetical protein
MPTGDHLNHRICDNYLESVVVRVVVLGKNGQNTKLEWVVQPQSKTVLLTATMHFFSTPSSRPRSRLAERGAWWAHWLKCSAKSRKTKLFRSPVDTH